MWQEESFWFVGVMALIKDVARRIKVVMVLRCWAMVMVNDVKKKDEFFAMREMKEMASISL